MLFSKEKEDFISQSQFEKFKKSFSKQILHEIETKKTITLLECDSRINSFFRDYFASDKLAKNHSPPSYVVKENNFLSHEQFKNMIESYFYQEIQPKLNILDDKIAKKSSLLQKETKEISALVDKKIESSLSSLKSLYNSKFSELNYTIQNLQKNSESVHQKLESPSKPIYQYDQNSITRNEFDSHNEKMRISLKKLEDLFLSQKNDVESILNLSSINTESRLTVESIANRATLSTIEKKVNSLLSKLTSFAQKFDRKIENSSRRPISLSEFERKLSEMETQIFIMTSVQKTLESNLRETMSTVISEIEREIMEMYNSKGENGVSLGVKKQINGIRMNNSRFVEESIEIGVGSFEGTGQCE